MSLLTVLSAEVKSVCNFFALSASLWVTLVWTPLFNLNRHGLSRYSQLEMLFVTSWARLL